EMEGGDSSMAQAAPVRQANSHIPAPSIPTAPQQKAKVQAKSSKKGKRPKDYVISKPSLEGQPNTGATPVQYKVQIANAAQLIDTNTGSWKKVNYSIEVLRTQLGYKYLAIGFKDFETAVKAKNELRQKGFQEAFVVAYQNGQRISLDQARAQR
ncbi:MAG: hypothetical protein AAFP19_16850, partial [Bacteroidota bacterium]